MWYFVDDVPFSSFSFLNIDSTIATEKEDPSLRFVSPCGCKGSMQFVHEVCLLRWIDELESRATESSFAPFICAQCGKRFAVETPEPSLFFRAGWLCSRACSEITPIMAMFGFCMALWSGLALYGGLVYSTTCLIPLRAMMAYNSPKRLFALLPVIPLTLIGAHTIAQVRLQVTVSRHGVWHIRVIPAFSHHQTRDSIDADPHNSVEEQVGVESLQYGRSPLDNSRLRNTNLSSDSSSAASEEVWQNEELLREAEYSSDNYGRREESSSAAGSEGEEEREEVAHVAGVSIELHTHPHNDGFDHDEEDDDDDILPYERHLRPFDFLQIVIGSLTLPFIATLVGRLFFHRTGQHPLRSVFLGG